MTARRDDPPRTAALWVVALAGIAFWTVHVLAEAAVVPYSRHHHAVVWAMHALTAALAALTLAAAVTSLRIARRAGAPEHLATPAGRTAYLGWLGVVVNSCNLLLIVVEGVYLAVLWNHA